MTLGELLSRSHPENCKHLEYFHVLSQSVAFWGRKPTYPSPGSSSCCVEVCVLSCFLPRAAALSASRAASLIPKGSPVHGSKRNTVQVHGLSLLAGAAPSFLSAIRVNLHLQFSGFALLLQAKRTHPTSPLHGKAASEPEKHVANGARKFQEPKSRAKAWQLD